MPRYARLGLLVGVITFCIFVTSLNLWNTSPNRLGLTSESHLQGEELLGAKLSEAFAPKGHHDEKEPRPAAGEEAHNAPVQGEAIRPEAKQEEGKNEETVDVGETDLQPPTRPKTETTNTNGEPPEEEDPDAWMIPQDPADEQPVDPANITKIIVMGKMSSEDTDWVGQEMHEWRNAIYQVDLPPDVQSPTGFRTKVNKAKEVMPYLTYIIDHYPNFPDVMAFIHAHRKGMPAAWHNDAPNYDAVNMLNALRLETVLDRGYVNLRCNNEVGCPDEIQPFRSPPAEDKHAEHAYPYIYAHFFNVSFDEMRETIPIVATQCCAQFAVSRAQILKRSKSEYERYRNFVEETHYDDSVTGRVLEYMWHIIFGREAVHCENVFECWCAVYGRCRHTGAGGLSRHGGAFG